MSHFDSNIQCDEFNCLDNGRCECGLALDGDGFCPSCDEQGCECGGACGSRVYSEMCPSCQADICRQEEAKDARDAAMNGWDDDVIYADEYADERDFGIDG